MPMADLPPALVALLAAPFIGSLLGVLVRRLPEGRPVALARSCCEACGHALGPAELVPLASFLWQRGRCRHCGARIASAHLWIELAALAVPATAALAEADPAGLWADCVLGWTLLALGWIDWTHLRLPDALSLPLLLAGLTATALLDSAAVTDHAWAAIAGYGSLRLLATGYRRLRGREGLGGGDAKLLAASGAWVGLSGLGPVLLIAAVAGLVAALLRGGGLRANTVVRLRAATVVPLGTCLALGTWAVRLLWP